MTPNHLLKSTEQYIQQCITSLTFGFGSVPGSQISCRSPQFNHDSFLVLLGWLVALVVYGFHKGLCLQCGRSNPILGNMHSRFQKAGTKFGLYLDSPHRNGIGFPLQLEEHILIIDSVMVL